jgi:hypothetical protein
LQEERIFSAPSLSEVIKQLLMYRLTGVLTIWPAAGPRQEEAWLAIEQGKPVYFEWNTFKENVNESMLTWLDSWGAIYFTFLSTEVRLQLPAPVQRSQQEEPAALPPETPTRPTRPRLRSAIPQGRNTTPLPAVRWGRPIQKQGAADNNTEARMQALQKQEIQQKRESVNGSSPPIFPETYVAILTENGRNYPITNLPRYERTIFLLINGRRSLADLVQLTKRPVEEVLMTLTRLEKLQLIIILKA